MKKSIFNILAVAFAGLSFSACQSEFKAPDASATHTVVFSAEQVATKTGLSIDGTAVHYAWKQSDTEGDKFKVFENGVEADLVVPELKDGKMSITATFPSEEAPANAKYLARFNSGVNASQYWDETDYAQDSDILVSEEAEGDINGDGILFRFTRVSAFGQMTLKELGKGEFVNSVKIETTDGKILAAEYDFANNQFAAEGSATLNIETLSTIANNQAVVRFVTVPVQDAMLKITATTIDSDENVVATYEKTFTKSISFSAGDLFAFGAVMEEATVDVVPDPIVLYCDDITTSSYVTEDTHIANEQWPIFYSDVMANAKNTPSGWGAGQVSQWRSGSSTKNPGILFNTQSFGAPIKKIEVFAQSNNVFYVYTGTSPKPDTNEWSRPTTPNGSENVYITDNNGNTNVEKTLYYYCYSITEGNYDYFKIKNGSSTNYFYKIVISFEAGDAPVTIEYSINIDQNIDGGTVTSNVATAAAGTSISLTATPDEGFEFTSWNVINATTLEEITVEEDKFTMPASDVNVSATFTETSHGDDEESVSFIFNTDAGLSALGITKPSASAGTNLGTKAYTSGPIIMTTTDGGTATRVWNKSGVTDLRIYKDGGSLTFTGATITKIEFSGSSLTNLAANCETYTNGLWTGSATSITFTASGSVNVNSIDVTYASGTAVTKYSVSCNTGEGGSLSASPASAEEGETVTLTATPSTGYEFNNDWSVKDASNTTVTVTDSKFSMPASNVTVSGSFSKVNYNITKNDTENGTYTVKKGETEVSQAQYGDEITLTANPDDNYILDHWEVVKASGGNVSVNGNAFYMPASAVSISAYFVAEAAVPEYASLEDLVAAELTSGTIVKVSFENVPIKSIYVTSNGGYRNGIYFNIQKDGKDIEIYYQNVPANWVVGGTVSGTMTCPWKNFNGTWELAPEQDSWDWNNLTYTAPLTPCADPEITISGSGSATITCATEGASIYYTVGATPADPTETSTLYSGAVTMTDGQTIKAIAYKDGMAASAVVQKTYTAGGSQTYSYTYTSKAWADGTGSWESGKDGNGLTSGQGVQITNKTTGANATSKSSFSNVSKIVVTYCTNAKAGKGSIKIQVGSGTVQSFSVSAPSSGGTTLKTTEFTFTPAESGKVKISVDCETNSIYIYSIAITAN